MGSREDKPRDISALKCRHLQDGVNSSLLRVYSQWHKMLWGNGVKSAKDTPELDKNLVVWAWGTPGVGWTSPFSWIDEMLIPL